VTIAN